MVGTAHTSPGVRSLVKSVVGGLRAWQQPEAAAEGLGGTYFFMDEAGRKTAIIKPCDEEPMAPNNPKVGGVVVGVHSCCGGKQTRVLLGRGHGCQAP